jgi:hypothetical protein
VIPFSFNLEEPASECHHAKCIMVAARACLEGYTAPSRATLTFLSSGKVASVTVAGPAAGTPAATCITEALSKPVVGPFRRVDFVLTTTVSPP